jgi:hypothetical protein
MIETELQCSYARLENDVHQLVFLKSSNVAMDQCLAHLKRIYAEHPSGERLKYLIDMRPAGLPPLRYTMSALRTFFAAYDDLPETRAAYIYESSALVRMGQTLLDFLRLKTERRPFPSAEEGQAMAWLLEE